MALSSKTSSETPGKLGRLVRMDYSGAYRQNDQLNGHLDQRLSSLSRSAQRRLTEREEELETARADADTMVRLKEAVNSRQEGQEEDLVNIVCSAWRRNSTLGSSIMRKRSAATSGSLRRPSSMLSSMRDGCLGDGVEGEGENGVMGDLPPSYSSSSSTSSPFPDLRKMSLTERRLAKERDQFSARNLFNVRRKNSSAVTDHKRRDVSPDSAKADNPSSSTTTTTTTLPNSHPPSSSKGRHQRGRPRTSPAAYGRGRISSSKTQQGYMRPTTASAVRLAAVSGKGGEAKDSGYHPRAPRRPRSRRELQRLVELKVDPFEEEEEEEGDRLGEGEGVKGRSSDSWTSSGDRRQDLLRELHVGQSGLQARVTAFLATVGHFTRRERQTGLEHILEAS